MTGDRCPCGTGDRVDDCCGPLLDGHRAAPTAEALMRSRYSAFVLGRHDYVLDTWHPDTRPGVVDEEPGLRWTRLDVLEVRDGGPFSDAGSVGYAAHWTANGRRGQQREDSSFVRVGGRWSYVGPVARTARPPRSP